MKIREAKIKYYHFVRHIYLKQQKIVVPYVKLTNLLFSTRYPKS